MNLYTADPAKSMLLDIMSTTRVLSTDTAYEGGDIIYKSLALHFQNSENNMETLYPPTWKITILWWFDHLWNEKQSWVHADKLVSPRQRVYLFADSNSKNPGDIDFCPNCREHHKILR